MRAPGALLLALLLGVLAGCAAGDDGFVVPRVGPARLDVDTPELRALKKEVGVEPCVPGSGRSDLPPVTLPCLGGGPDVRLDQLRGPLLVSVWATWCAPCRKELPLLQRYAEEYDGRVDVIGINFTDQYPAKALRLLDRSGARFPQLADFGEEIVTGRPPFPALKQLPMLAVVDAEGQVSVQVTRIDTYAELTGLVERHLGAAPA